MEAGAKPEDDNNNQPATPTTGQRQPSAKDTRARSRHREQGKAKDGGFSHLKPEQREAIRRYHEEKQGKAQDQQGKTKATEKEEDATHNNQGETGRQKPGTTKDNSQGHLNQDRRKALLNYYNEQLKTTKQETGEDDRKNEY